MFQSTKYDEMIEESTNIIDECNDKATQEVYCAIMIQGENITTNQMDLNIKKMET